MQFVVCFVESSFLVLLNWVIIFGLPVNDAVLLFLTRSVFALLNFFLFFATKKWENL